MPRSNKKRQRRENKKLFAVQDRSGPVFRRAFRPFRMNSRAHWPRGWLAALPLGNLNKEIEPIVV